MSYVYGAHTPPFPSSEIRFFQYEGLDPDGLEEGHRRRLPPPEKGFIYAMDQYGRLEQVFLQQTEEWREYQLELARLQARKDFADQQEAQGVKPLKKSA